MNMYNLSRRWCYYSNELNLAYIPIPKNASTWTIECLENIEFQSDFKTPQFLNNQPNIVVLRDPIDKWISGIAEYISIHFKWDNITNDIMYTNNLEKNLIVQIIFSQLEFDVHTCSQVSFISGLNHDNCVFFKLDANYIKNISTFFKNNYNISINLVNDMHATRNNKKMLTKEVFVDIIKNNKALHERTKVHFNDDFDLINNVDFYKA